MEHIPSGPVYPALQTQEKLDELETDEAEPGGHARQVAAAVAPVVAEYFPAAQAVHVAEPAVVLYVPATHVVHAPPLGPVNPTLHVQAVRAELEIGELELVGQAAHVVVVVVPHTLAHVTQHV